MLDIRTNKRVNEKSVKFADDDVAISYLSQSYDDEGGTVVGIFSADGDCVSTIDSEDMAENLIRAITYAIDNDFWNN